MNKKVLISAILIITSLSYVGITGMGSGQQTVKKEESKKIQDAPLVGDILKIKDNVMGEVKKMTDTVNKKIVSQAKNITKGSPDQIVGNVSKIVGTLKDGLTSELVNNVMTIIKQIETIENIKVVGVPIFKLLGDVTKISPKVKSIIDNLKGTIDNLNYALIYVLQDLKIPIDEVQKLMVGMKSTGLYELIGKKDWATGAGSGTSTKR